MPNALSTTRQTAPTPQDYRRRVRAATDHAQRNLHRPLTLAELADAAGFSPFHFHRIFAGMTGETIGAFVRRLRLEQAASHLEFTAKSVTRIAAEACYDSLEAFSRAFKTHFGQTPSDYRRQAPDTRRRRVGQADAPKRAAVAARDAQAVSVVVRPALRVVSMRAQGPYMESSFAAWDNLYAWAAPRGLFTPQTVCLGMAYDDPGLTAPEKLRYDACLSVGPEVAADGDAVIMVIEGGEFAKAEHRGPYDELEQAYVDLFGTWLPVSGRMPATRPAFEIYRNFPGDTPAENLLTEMYLPLEPLTPTE